MDAPTTTSADNGTSGGSGGGGWFTPRKQPQTPPGGGQETPEGGRLAAMRPVRRPAPSEDAEQPRIPQAPPATAPTERPRAEPEPAHEVPRSVAAPGGPVPGFSPSGGAASGALQDAPAQRAAAVPPSAPVQPASGFPEAAAGQSASVLPEAVDGQSDSLLPQGVAGPATDSRETAPDRPATEASWFAAGPEPRVPSQRSAPEPEASPDAVLIRRTMSEVGPIADKVTSYFYALLFVRHPDLRSLFPAAMDAQRDRLLKALLTAAEHIDNTEVLVAYLQNLGRGHRKYGTRPEHYPAVGECLIGALSKYASAIWDEETEAAWVRAYTTISQVMIDAAAADELLAPAWWYAEVVSHDLRTPDIAVITVRPDQPYPFLAGQYTSLETPWWPRVWRHYSFASAPRSDGLLSFHVKAVPAGWVSNALVHRARPGDVIRLGPPAGTMTVDHTTESGLLCLGGGTGIAPIKALVEDVAKHGQRRPVEVFYGARTGHDLYDIDTMLRLQQSHPWLSVRPVVDEQANLQLPDVIREYGPWNEYDAYLSGPPGMIRSGVDALRDIGIPSERIRHDSVEELVGAGG
ncbi:globin domain-containing protein [Streptomyces yaanensis]|uniref:nitric oxide dioxygenase n=1 Tax=Streptomyces yaanensis TaxID=1142239 RepID=A0ABV7SB54_9ACTN|nr:globin domain-containing protein [Streptomyces sp. CGMCC 4.7035]WNC02919.1 globin domain-containing protein [Streptomyces sp. CGMCC 4.7035]